MSTWDTVGRPGATVDVLAMGEALALVTPRQEGALEQVQDFELRVAGAEMNALIGLARLGHRTTFVSALGEDPFGRLIHSTLEREGVGIEHLSWGSSRTGVFFKERLAEHGRRVYYYRDGSSASSLTPGAALTALDATRPRVVLASGLTLGIGPLGGLGDACAALLTAAGSHGCTVVFDANLRLGIWHGPQAAAQFNDLLPFLDVVLAGEHELATLRPSRDVDRVAADLVAAGLSAVVVKYGSRGSVVSTSAGTTPIAPVPVRAIDPIGAGDAFAAGFVSGLLRGWDPVTAARLGSELGAAAVGSLGDWESLPRGQDAAALVARFAPVEHRDPGLVS